MIDREFSVNAAAIGTTRKVRSSAASATAIVGIRDRLGRGRTRRFMTARDPALGAKNDWQVSARLASMPPYNELGYVAESTRAVTVRIHGGLNCVLGFLAPLLRELRRCHASKSFPSRGEVREIETKRFGLHPSINSCHRELCEKRRGISQGSGAHARNWWRAGELAGCLLEEDNVALLRSRPHR